MMRRTSTRRAGRFERHGGTVEKFIGDAVVGMFGVPEAHEDDALRACRAALEIQERIESSTSSSKPASVHVSPSGSGSTAARSSRAAGEP